MAAPHELELYDRLQAATTRLDLVQLPDAIRSLIARLCLDGSVAGHRADLVVARTARAICALRGAALVELADVLEALELALAHRRRDAATDKPEQAQELASRAAEPLAQIQATSPLMRPCGRRRRISCAGGRPPPMRRISCSSRARISVRRSASARPAT